MSEVPTIDIDMDKKCSRCHTKGATPGGLCLKCAGDDMLKELERRQMGKYVLGKLEEVVVKVQEDGALVTLKVGFQPGIWEVCDALKRKEPLAVSVEILQAKLPFDNASEG